MTGKQAVLAGFFSLLLVFITAGLFFPPPEAALAAGVGRRSLEAETSPSLSAQSLESGSGDAWQGESIPSPQALRLLLPDGTVETMGLEDYVWRVVAAEMPASFEPAALEAQAVAARTYALRRAQGGAHSPDADLCASSGCCQACALQPPESWGADADFYTAKLRAAVSATAGEILTQDGKLIQAVFHASSAGQTAPAQAVWGAAAPYLVSVSTPETVETVPSLQAQLSFTDGELETLLGGSRIGRITYYDWGGVDTMEVGGQVLTGQEVRQKLSLRSTRFTVEQRDGKSVFTTTGYGHGVGMSQQGANLMAQTGAGYREILAHYYPGTQLEQSA